MSADSKSPGTAATVRGEGSQVQPAQEYHPLHETRGDDLQLIDELVLAQGALGAPQKAMLTAAGVPPKLIRLGLVGAARIVLEGGGYYPADEGEAAFVVPVMVDPDFQHGWETDDPAGAVWLGDIVDLVAFPQQRPQRWALRRDSAIVLGAIESQLLEPSPVRLWRSPLSWLRGGAVGLCPLTRRPAELQQILLKCHAIIAEDAAHARDLKRIAERPYRTPEIVAPGARRAA